MPTLYTFMDIEPIDPAIVSSAVASGLNVPVRRPIWGLELNAETHATLQIMYKDLSNAQMINSSTESGTSDATTNFVITHITHERREHLQISDSFLSLYINTFGEQPRFLTVRGCLLKSKNFPWKTEWLRNYDESMRASRTIEDGARLYLTIEDTIYEGHMITCQVLDQAESPMMSPMQFTMILTNVIYGTVGGAYLREESQSSTSSTRASRGEYLANNTETSPREPTYTLDENGNFVINDIDRVGLEDLWQELSKDERRVALALALTQGYAAEYTSWQPRNAHEEAILRDAFSSVDSERGVYRYVQGEITTAASDGDTMAESSARVVRVIDGRSSGGDGRVSDVEDDLFDEDDLAAFNNGRP